LQLKLETRFLGPKKAISWRKTLAINGLRAKGPLWENLVSKKCKDSDTLSLAEKRSKNNV
jgi:hypothetical protein